MPETTRCLVSRATQEGPPERWRCQRHGTIPLPVMGPPWADRTTGLMAKPAVDRFQSALASRAGEFQVQLVSAQGELVDWNSKSVHIGEIAPGAAVRSARLSVATQLRRNEVQVRKGCSVCL